jgi:L-gulonate 3-dehydrogenase
MTVGAENIVAIIGAGLIGRAWSVVFSRAGWQVRLTDPHAPTLAAAPELILQELRELAPIIHLEVANGAMSGA